MEKFWHFAATYRTKLPTLHCFKLFDVLLMSWACLLLLMFMLLWYISGCVYFHFLFIKIHFSNIDHHLALPILIRLKSISNCNKAAHQLALLSVKKTYGLEQWRRRFWMHSRFILRWDEGNSGVLWSKKSSVQTITLCERKNYLIALFDKF